MTYYLKFKHMICLDKNELARFYKDSKDAEYINEISKKGYTIKELKGNNQKIHEIVDTVVDRGLKDKDEVEIFAALFCYSEFYPKGSKICFVLKDGFNLSKDVINSLQDLKSAIKENELTDFGIFSNNELRQFQLKRYRGKLTAQESFDFIKNKIEHYAKDLGDINLLIVLQSSNPAIPNNFFHEVHEKLKEIKLVSDGQVLISYNENMQFLVMNQVYPLLKTTRIPLRFASHQLEDE